MGTIAYTIVCGIGPRVPRRYVVMSRARRIAKVAGVAVGAAVRLAASAYAAQRLRRDADAARRPTATRAARSTRRSTSTTGSTRTTAASIYVVERGRAGPADRAVARRHALGPHVVPPARDAAASRASARSRSTTAATASRCSATTGHSLENLARRHARRVVEGLDLRDAVLVGHSMGGVAVQAFVTQFPEIAAERVAGHRVAVDARAHAVRLALDRARSARIEQLTNRAPDMSWLWDVAEPRVPRRPASGFGENPHPSHVELVRQMMLECPPETRLDAPRALVGLDLTARAPERAHPDARDRRHRRHAHAARARRGASRELIPGARLELFPGGGHMLMLERTEELDRLIVDFAREVGAPVERAARRRTDDARPRRPTIAIPIAGVRVGHWTGDGTGVTVVLLARRARSASGEVRGGAPASRARSRCSTRRAPSTRVDAVVFAGGSAFGLAAADGVMRFLAERGQGFPTAGGPVPIVPAACVFDLVEAGGAPPGADDGYAAAVAADGATSTSRPAGSARAGARPSASGAAASTRCPAGSASRVGDGRRRARRSRSRS